MILKKVIAVRFYRLPSTPTRYGGGKELSLECGHSVRKKYSEQTPKRCRCVDCEKTQQDEKS